VALPASDGRIPVPLIPQHLNSASVRLVG